MKIVLLRKSQLTRDRDFFIDEGSTITENYNETLDSANIRISHISERLDIEPYDKVVLVDEENRLPDKYMCVDTYVETMESLDPVLYSYEISLFSETKELEGISLPSLSITRRPDGSGLSVFQHITNYFDLYEPQVMTANNETGESYQLRGKYRFLWTSTPGHPRLADKFNVPCPEMQWNNPTFREVLTDLMMVVDCIPVVRNGVIDYIDLTQKRNPIDTSKVNYIQRSQSAEDYVSELRMNMQNVMQTQVDGVDNTCNKIEWFGFTTSGYVITSKNIVLKTQFPINTIKHLWIMVPVLKYGTTDYERFIKIDLCDVNGSGYSFVKEKTIYDTLDIDRTTTDYWTKTISHVTSHMNYCVYFTRGSNTIEGWGEDWKQYDLMSLSEYVLQMIVRYIEENYPTDTTGQTHTSGLTYPDVSYGNSYFSIFFQIEYETLASDVFQASKNIAPTHNRIIVDNQTNSYVDAYNQGFMEYQKANRLGNQQLHINARYENNFDNILSIGDYYEDSIVFQTQYQIYKNHIEVNASATKGYILRNYFTGVKAHIRSWKIADGSDALIRHELNKHYLEFSDHKKSNYENDAATNAVIRTNLARYFLSPFYSWEAKPLEYCFLYTATESAGTRPYNNNYKYTVDLNGRVIGNSVVFTFGFEDNYDAGKRVSSEVDINKILVGEDNVVGTNVSYRPFRVAAQNWSNQYGGILLEPCRYCDNNGEFHYMAFSFTPEIENSLSNIVQRIVAPGYGNIDKSYFLLEMCMKPEVPMENLIFDETKYYQTLLIWKDNREIIRISNQFEFCCDTNKILFTKKFVEMQESVRNVELPTSTVSNTVTDQQGSGTGIGQTIRRTVHIDTEPSDVYNYSYRLVTSNINISGEAIRVIADTTNGGSILEFYCTLDSIIDPQSPASLDCYFTYSYNSYVTDLSSYKVRYKLTADDNFIDEDITGTTVLGDGNLITITSVTNACATLEINTTGLTDVEKYTFYITYTDTSGEHLLFAMMGMNKVYLNYLVTRDYSIYDASGKYVINGI